MLGNNLLLAKYKSHFTEDSGRLEQTQSKTKRSSSYIQSTRGESPSSSVLSAPSSIIFPLKTLSNQECAGEDFGSVVNNIGIGNSLLMLVDNRYLIEVIEFQFQQFSIKIMDTVYYYTV